MRVQGYTRVVGMTGLLAGILMVTMGAQEARDEAVVRPQDIIRYDEFRAASHAAVQPAAPGAVVREAGRVAPDVLSGARATAGPATAMAQSTINLTNFRADLPANVRLTQYDPATRERTDVSDISLTNLRAGQYLAVASNQIKLAPLPDTQGREYSHFQTLLITINADSSMKNLRVDQYSDGFRWSKEHASFLASIFLRVSDADDPSSDAPLETPILIKVSGPALQESVDREISKLGLRGEQDVLVRSAGHIDPVGVKVRTEINPDQPENFELPLDKPKLIISANPADINAFGIEATTITIDSQGKLPAGFPITLSSDAGTFEQANIVVDTTGTATARLWSAGLGSANVQVADERFLAVAEPVKFLPPVQFLIATTLGAALGAAFIYFWRRSSGSVSIWVFLAAFVFGIGITIAVFAGFEIPKMLNLPQGRTGLVVPAATAFIAATLVSTIYGALSGSGGKNTAG